MKKETVITAVVFLSVGFLAGYTYNAQRNLSRQAIPGAAPVAAAPAADATSSAGADGTLPDGQLPPGHPPVDNQAAVKFLEDQAAQNPADPQPRVRLANLMFDERDFQRAAEWYQRALSLDPKDVNARTDLGTCYFNLGRSDQALAEFRKSLEINPRHEPTLYNIVVVNLDSGRDLAAAREAWGKLYKLNPRYPNLDRLKQELDAASGAARASSRPG